MSHPPFDPLPPLPVLPIPVEPPYAYQPPSPQGSGRPAIISIIAITSLVIGIIGILASAGFAFMDFGLLMASSAAKSAPVPVIATAQATVTTGGTPERLPFAGLSSSDRQTFEMGIQRVRSLSNEQIDQLDELLAENGKTVNGEGAVLPPDQLANGVSSSGHHSFGDTTGSDYFVLGNGKLELSDDRAVFFPTGLPSIRSNAIVIPTPATPATPKSLLPDQIRSVVRAVNDVNGAKIKSTQAKTLIATLQSPGEDIIIPTTDGTDPAYEVSAASSASDGTLTLSSIHGSTSSNITIDASGMVTSQSTVSTTATATYTGPIIDRTAGLTALSLTAVQVAPAIFLLITGILTLRYSPRGRMLHWIYVGLKLPLAIACGGVSFWMWTSVIQSAMVNSGPGAPTTQAATAGSTVAGAMFGAAPDLLGCIWPVVLIFMLTNKNVRLYYAAGTAGRIGY